jgi:hypothetical protein
VRPAFPSSWGRAEIVGLRLGDGKADLLYRPGEIRFRWNGSRPLEVATARGSTAVAPGSSATLPVDPPASEERAPGQTS